MPNNECFDSKRDRAIIETGGFFCEGCLVGKLTQEQSPDPRYCQQCYEFLLKEAGMLIGHVKKVNWIPKKPTRLAAKKASHMSKHGGGIMSTLESKKFGVDIINPVDATKTGAKRGPKHKALPVELIKQWAGEGMGSKAIAAKLKAEQYIGVSYKTIQRLLSGESKQLALPMNEP